MAEAATRRGASTRWPLHRAALAARLYAERRQRAASFGPLAKVFRDPAWDVALHLFVAAEDGLAVPVSAAAKASGTPTTTGLRCIDAMVAAGLLRRRDDPDDARRSIVALTPTARQAMSDYLDSLR